VTTIAQAGYENTTGVLKKKQIQFARPVFDVEIVAIWPAQTEAATSG
jgi:hypothetical protein